MDEGDMKQRDVRCVFSIVSVSEPHSFKLLCCFLVF